MTEEFTASLVREKIIFADDSAGSGAEPTVIKSNRIFLKLGVRAASEKIVVRAQNMHTTLRIASKILFSHHKGGALLERDTPFDWEGMWDQVLSTYEKEFNPAIWAAVYINGKPFFKTNKSPFVDVIEKCALLTIDNYDATMGVTESALKQIGRAVRINHSSNVATVFTDNGDSMRCGIIHRAGRTRHHLHLRRRGRGAVQPRRAVHEHRGRVPGGDQPPVRRQEPAGQDEKRRDRQGLEGSEPAPQRHRPPDRA